MKQKNPFSDVYDASRDTSLLEEAIEGNRSALDELVQRHNSFIYNIALKMLGNEEDAKDVSQEILIKMITNLARYDAEKAQFRTWLYRIAFNFILNVKKSSQEKRITSFSQFFGVIEQVKEEEIPEGYGGQADALRDETMIKCMHGMLMCIPREDRLLYIVGDLFRANHSLGAEIFQISPDNYRKKLSRTRNNLRQWMDNKCGLINKENPCRCARKTRGFIQRGIVDPKNLMWDKGFTERIAAFTEENLQEALKSSDKVYTKLYQEHPLKEPLSAHEMIQEIISDKNIQEVLNL